MQTISGPYVPSSQTESTPLKRSNIFSTTKLSVIKWLWGWDESPDQSLRIILFALFGSAAIVTLALFTQLYHKENQVAQHGAVVTDSPQCSQIGIDILKDGGNAVDAAIASTFCLGVVHFHITGLGGGGSSLIYNHKSQKVVSALDFQPSAQSTRQETITSSGQTVGAPGFLLGLWTLYTEHSSMTWSDLIMPSVLLARDGFIVEDPVFDAIHYLNHEDTSTLLYQLMSTLVRGERIKLPKLSAALELIAAKGPAVFYNGTLAEDLVYSVRLKNGSLLREDLAQYRTIRRVPLQTKFYEHDVIVPSDSFGGSLLLDALDDIALLDLNTEKDDTYAIIHKLSLTLYDVFIRMLKKNNGIHHSGQVSGSSVLVVDDDFNYVSVMTGLNTWLGSQILTESGFILNSALLNGGISEEKRPISLITPAIVVPSQGLCGKRLITGGGDSRIAAEVLAELLLLKNDTQAAIEAPRFLIGNESQILIFEEQHYPPFDDLTVTDLVQRGKRLVTTITPPYTSFNVISIVNDNVLPYADSRGKGIGLQF